MAGNPLRESSGGEEREDIMRAVQLRAGEPKATEWGRAEPVSGRTETLGGFLPAAFPDLAGSQPSQLLGTQTGT